MLSICKQYAIGLPDVTSFYVGNAFKINKNNSNFVKIIKRKTQKLQLRGFFFGAKSRN